jgi:hypothetical protein
VAAGAVVGAVVAGIVVGAEVGTGARVAVAELHATITNDATSKMDPKADRRLLCKRNIFFMVRLLDDTYGSIRMAEARPLPTNVDRPGD